MMKILFLLLFIVGCNSETASLTSIQGMRNPNNPLGYITNLTPPSDGIYYPTNTLYFDVEFSEPVEVSGLPQVGIQTDNGVVYAVYSAGSGTNTLTFTYTVSSGEMDSDGISFTDPLILSGGSIVTPEDGDLVLTSFSAPSTGIQINGANSTYLGFTPPADKTYVAGEHLDFLLNFDFPVMVSGGPPYIVLNIGGNLVNANYYSGSGSTVLTFRYTVASDNDLDGIVVQSGAYNGSTISDIFGDPANITFSGISLPGVLVDSLPPTIASVDLPPNRTHYPGEVLSFNVNFSENVSLTSGAPRLELRIGTTIQYAALVSASSSSFNFEYTIQPGDNDINGDLLTSFDLNGAVIIDMAGNVLTNTSMVIPSATSMKVDTTAPTIGTISSPSGTFKAGDTLTFTVSSGSVLYVDTTNGIPKLQLDIGTITKFATYSGGSGSTNLEFTYVVEPDLLDDLGVGIISPLNLNSGTIKDGNIPQANNLNLNFTSQEYAHTMVDSYAPYIPSATLPANGHYYAGDTLDFTLQFSENVYVSGTPELAFTLDSGTVQASFVTGSGTSNLTFRLTVLSDHVDLSGIQLSSITLTSGSIRDSAGNNINTSLPLVDLSKVLILPGGLTYWFDVSDPATIGTSGFSTLQQFSSKIGTKSGTITGSIPFSADTMYIDPAAGDSITISSLLNITYVLIAFKNPLSPLGQTLMSDTVNGSLSYAVDGTMNFSTCSSCRWLNDGELWSPITLGNLDGYDWRTQPERMLLIKFPSALSVDLILGSGSFNGKIAEVMIFTGTVPNATFTAIGSYLTGKLNSTWHGAVY